MMTQIFLMDEQSLCAKKKKVTKFELKIVIFHQNPKINNKSISFLLLKNDLWPYNCVIKYKIVFMRVNRE